MQFEAEGTLTFCDSICSQQTLQTHKKYKTEEIHFNCIIVYLYYNDGLKQKKDFITY